MREQSIDPDRSQIEHRAQRLDVGQLHLGVFECGDRRIRRVANVELIHRYRPVQANQRLRLRLHEMHVHIRRQCPVRNFDRQLHRRVADVKRQVEPMQFQVNDRVVRGLERLGHARNPDRAAVDHHLQQRFDEHVHVGGQVRDKRHVDLNLLDLVLLAEQLIVDCHFAIAQLNIRNRESHRRAGRRRLRFFRRRRALQQVGKVEALLRLPNDMDRRPLDYDFADYRRKSENRRPRNLHSQVPDIDERFWTVALANVQLVHVEPQRIKIESDFAHAHGPMDAASDGADQDVPQQRRNRQVSRRVQEQHDRDDDHPDFPRSPRTAQLARARNPWPRGMKRRPYMSERGFQVLARAVEKIGHQP